MSYRILVLAGTPQQFTNFAHAFGDRFIEIRDESDLRAHNGGRQLILLVGTWVMNPLRERVLAWAAEKDQDHRPRGQCFTLMGRAK